MKCKPHHIHLKNDATPFAVNSPLPIAYHWRDAVTQILDNYVDSGILTHVEVGEPVEWCTRMIVIAKKDGTPRITVDYQELNQHIKRETHHTPFPFDAISSIPLHSY